MTLDDLITAMPELEPGHVWLVGAGPGDPAHLTVMALAGLRQADVVVHDALIDPAVLALSGAELVAAGKRGGKPSAVQADICAQLVALARAGKRVVRLKGGDPFMFGRGGEEAVTLAEQGVPFRIVPGLTSGLAAMSAALMPPTMRGINQAVVLVTGHGADRREGLDWGALARLGQPIILYMGMTNLAAIVGALVEGGMAGSVAAAAIASVATRDQRVVVATVETLVAAVAREAIGAPAIIVIGAIVETRARLMALLPELQAGGI